MNCKTCNKPLNLDQQRTGFCSKECAEASPSVEEPQKLQNNKREENKERYPALRILSKIYVFFSILSGIIGAILVIVALSKNLPVLFLYGIITAILGIVINLAISEGILLFIDIESNTRKTHELLADRKVEPGVSGNG